MLTLKRFEGLAKKLDCAVLLAKSIECQTTYPALLGQSVGLAFKITINLFISISRVTVCLSDHLAPSLVSSR